MQTPHCALKLVCCACCTTGGEVFVSSLSTLLSVCSHHHTSIACKLLIPELCYSTVVGIRCLATHFPHCVDPYMYYFMFEQEMSTILLSLARVPRPLRRLSSLFLSHLPSLTLTAHTLLSLSRVVALHHGIIYIYTCIYKYGKLDQLATFWRLSLQNCTCACYHVFVCT